MSRPKVHGIMKMLNTVTNELFYHQIERILQKYTNITIISYAENERVNA